MFAEKLSALLRPGDVLCLQGDLGAGKTTLTRGLVRALGSPARVSSPTFTLIHEYDGGRVPVVHVDAYRLSGAAEGDDAGIGEYLQAGDRVTVIEWSERITELLPPDRLEIVITDKGDDRRMLTLFPHGSRWDSNRESLQRLAVC